MFRDPFSEPFSESLREPFRDPFSGGMEWKGMEWNGGRISRPLSRPLGSIPAWHQVCNARASDGCHADGRTGAVVTLDPRAVSAIAYLVHSIRPSWDRAGVEAIVRTLPDDLAAATHAAIVAAATRPDQKTPAVIAMTGSHWGTCTGDKPPVALPAWRDRYPAKPDVPPETIAQQRARLAAALTQPAPMLNPKETP